MNANEPKPQQPAQHAGINKAFEQAIKKAMLATVGVTGQINNLQATRERMRLTVILGELTEDAIRKAMVGTIHSLLAQVEELPEVPTGFVSKDAVERMLGKFLASVTQEANTETPHQPPNGKAME